MSTSPRGVQRGVIGKAVSLAALFLALVQSGWAIDTDNDTLPDTFESNNGRDPLVPEYLISAGWNTTCGKDDSATNGQGVQCWGANSTNLNNNMPTFTTLTQIVNGSQHACAIDNDSVVCWGSNFDGRATPPAMINVTQLSAFKNHTCAVHDAGVSCWGKETVGQTIAPVMNNPQMVAVGDTHSCAIDENAGVNSVVCWGSDDWGESTPPALTQPIFIAAGDEHNCVIDDLGSSKDVVCWGSNGSGRSNPPVMTNPLKLALGGVHSCAIDEVQADVTNIVCWGDGSSGQMLSPLTTQAVSISSGYNHTCVLSNEGIQCWGSNSNGQSDVSNLFLDSDGDGEDNLFDACYLDDLGSLEDTDRDGLCNEGADTDDDNDAIADVSDAFPTDFYESADADGDGIGTNEELRHLTDPDNADNRPYWRQTIYGDSAGDAMGISVSNAGDVDNDGYADVIVGASSDDEYGANSGSARVYSGQSGQVLYSFYGATEGAGFGYSVSGAGDVNNDGYADLIVGASSDDRNGDDAGSARVFSGLDGTQIYQLFGDYGDDAGDRFGVSVSGAGDVNNDGCADVIIGADGVGVNGSNAGAAKVVSGIDGTTLYDFYGDGTGDFFGRSVSAVGDVNNDGYTDLIVGAPYDDNSGSQSGSARVFSGANGSVLYTFNGDGGSDYFGTSVSGAGDVNNDGYADLIVGAPYDDNNGNSSGSAKVLSGINGDVLYLFNGDVDGEFFGASVSGAGDINNDGYADVIMGARLSDDSGPNAGSARVFSGLNGVRLYDLDGDGNFDNNYFGYSVSGGGDIDADGYADFIVGAFSDDDNHVDAGSARIYLSSLLLNDLDQDNWEDNIDPSGDMDSDGVLNADDNCLSVSNPGQENTDGDLQGDACDEDDDNDGVMDVDDDLPLNQCGAVDTDNDGLPDNNLCYTGFFEDFQGGVSGWDFDPSAFIDDGPSGVGGYQSTRSAIAMTVGVSGIGYWKRTSENFPVPVALEFYTAYESEFELYIDGELTPSTGEVDNGWYRHTIDLGAGTYDIDWRAGPVRFCGGGIVCPYFKLDDVRIVAQFEDQDDDNDGTLDEDDEFPLDPSEWNDNDNDGTGDNADLDDDNDGMPDTWETLYGLNPLFDDAAGDLDGDGRTNLLEYQNGTNPAVVNGQSIIYNINGGQSHHGFGFSVSDVGDVNNDGYADVIIGAAVDNFDVVSPGGARVVSGADAAILYTLDEGVDENRFGYSAAGAGDVNGDGYSDFIVGAPYDDDNGAESGSAWLYSGVDGSLIRSHLGDSADDFFGWSVHGAGDVNNDGYDDVIVGAYLDDNNGADSGMARVFSGIDGATLYTFDGLSAGARFGNSVAGADINNDGYSDLIVGAPYSNNNGQVQVFSGIDGSVMYTFTGAAGGDAFGHSVSAAGDTNGNGYTDIIIGAYWNDANGERAGAAYLRNGANGALLKTFTGDSPHDYFGWSVSDAGDVNADGYDDVVIGALYDDNNGDASGSVRVYNGSDGAVIYAFEGDDIGDNLGYAVSGAGDINDDGYADVIVGARYDDNGGPNSGRVRIFNGAGQWVDTDNDTNNDLIDNDDDNDGSLDIDEAFPLDPAKIGDSFADDDGDGVVNDDDAFPLDDCASVDTDSDGMPDDHHCPVLYIEDFEDGFSPQWTDVGIIDNPGTGRAGLVGTSAGGNTTMEIQVSLPRSTELKFQVQASGSGAYEHHYQVDGGNLITLYSTYGAYWDHPGTLSAGAHTIFFEADYFISSWADLWIDNITFTAAPVTPLDNDDDNDGVSDTSDAFPLDPAESDDTDSDGIGNNADTDDDNDTVLDGADNCPLNANVGQDDYDNDGLGDACDSDGDNDGVLDINDDFPLNEAASLDADNDGYPDEWNAGCDTGCQAGSGLTIDNCPVDANPAQADFDGDLIGDVCDDDDDNDGYADPDDNYPLNPDRWLADTNILYQLSMRDEFGNSMRMEVGRAGDINNDGYDDIILGYAAHNNSTGVAQVVSGVDASLLYELYGDAEGDGFGGAVSGAGDVNNDGYADFIVGAQNNDVAGTDAGQAKVFSGSDGSILYVKYGENSVDRFGGSVLSYADINNDGYDEFIVAASNSDVAGTNSGAIYIYSGIDGTLYRTYVGNAANYYYGSAVAYAGDVDADGHGDIIVGRGSSVHDFGVRVISGLDGSYLHNINDGTSIGEGVSGAGDVNGDGYDDFIIAKDGEGSYGSQNTIPGYVRVIDGLTGNVLYHYDGYNRWDDFGVGVGSNASLAGVGDMNGDGYDDFVIGAPGHDNHGGTWQEDSGSAWAYSGVDGSLLYAWEGDPTAYGFGGHLSALGDVNGDGYADVIVAESDNLYEDRPASVRVFNGIGRWIDTDDDGTNDDEDIDDDADGYDDLIDIYPLNPAEWLDSDQDRVGNTADADDDNDGLLDGADNCSTVSNIDQTDTDLDGEGDACDLDDDNDLIPDVDDWLPRDPDRSVPDTPFVHRFKGNVRYDYFGYSADFAGDVNGDGCDDVVVGAYEDDAYGAYGGVARVYDGLSGKVLYVFSGPSSTGKAVSGAGDINNDGYQDIAVGYPSANNNGYSQRGGVYIYSGLDGSFLYLLQDDVVSYKYLGSKLSHLGDVNGDGYADIVTSSQELSTGYDTGAAIVFSGIDGAILYRFESSATPTVSDRYAWSIDGDGDVNGDEVNDILVGVNGAGVVEIYSGIDGSLIKTITDSRGLISSVSYVGDISGDGRSDIAIAVSNDSSDGAYRGSVHIIDSQTNAVIHKLYGSYTYAHFGSSVDGVGDLDNDGYDDFIVGANGNQAGQGGRVHVYSGKDASLIYAFEGLSAGDYFGNVVSGRGDINGDGYADILVGAVYDDNNDDESGAVTIFSGKGLWTDVDSDSSLDVVDTDDDNDGILDVNDAFPLNPFEWADLDNDRIGDNADQCDSTVLLESDADNDGCDDATEDLDDDNDGMPDDWENTYGLNPLDDSDALLDPDGDGFTNIEEYNNGTIPTVYDAVASVKDDYNNDGLAGWIWHGTGGAVDNLNRTWTPDWLAASPGWVPPTRTFPPPSDAIDGYDIVTTGDFNGDGDADWLWRESAGPGWKIWQMEGGYRAGQNTPVDFDAAHDWLVVGAGDTDLDGDDDVILYNSSTGEISIWEMQTTHVATHNIGSKAGFDVVRVGDFDGDVDADLMLRKQGEDVLRFWEIEDNALVQEHTTSQTGAGYVSQCAGDFNNDGNADVYFLAPDGTSKWYEYVNFVRQQQVFGANQSAWTLLGCGDYDGDGDMDILWTGADGLGYNRLFINESFNNSATYYTNRYGGTDPGNPGYGYEARANRN